jgi:hypothetical protein
MAEEHRKWKEIRRRLQLIVIVSHGLIFWTLNLHFIRKLFAPIAIAAHQNSINFSRSLKY